MKNSYSNKLTAWALLTLFLSFSLSAPLFHDEAANKSSVATATTIDLLGSVTINNFYNALNTKPELGKYRFASISWFTFGDISIHHFRSKFFTLIKQPVGQCFPLSTVPAYLFDRVLRI